MRIFSGIQPTGRKHLGNYIGAIRQYVEGQARAAEHGDIGIFCVVDLHGMTIAYDPVDMRERVYDTAAILLASGGARIMDLQDPTSKMSTTSGSVEGTVYLLDDAKTTEKKFKRAVTDSGTEIVRAPDKPGVSNLIDILAVARGVSQEEVERDMQSARGYGDLKMATAEAVNAM